jgi:hypothetical protein
MKMASTPPKFKGALQHAYADSNDGEEEESDVSGTIDESDVF